MEAQRKTFVEGSVARGVPRDKAAEIFEQVNKFAGYGFVKSHAAAYALVAYQTAFLKANHPLEFLAASMAYDLNNTDKLNGFKQELDRLGVPLLAPDINRSEPDFAVEKMPDGSQAIRYALAAIKNVGEGAMAGLVEERVARGPFKSLSDLAGRIDTHVINKRQLESLACAGALDSLDKNRRQVHAAAETLIRYAATATSERESSQARLFDDSDDSGLDQVELPQIDDWPPLERLQYEFEAIGFYLSAHPLDAYGESLTRLGAITHAELEAAERSEPGPRKLAGIVVGKQERTSRTSQNRFAFVQLSDSSGIYEVVVFNDLLARCRELLEAGRPLLLTVDARREADATRIMAQKIVPLDDAISRQAQGIRIFVSNPARLGEIQSLLVRRETGSGQICLVLDLDDGREVELRLQDKCAINPTIRQAIKAVPGIMVQDL